MCYVKSGGNGLAQEFRGHHTHLSCFFRGTEPRDSLGFGERSPLLDAVGVSVILTPSAPFVARTAEESRPQPARFDEILSAIRPRLLDAARGAAILSGIFQDQRAVHKGPAPRLPAELHYRRTEIRRHQMRIRVISDGRRGIVVLSLLPLFAMIHTPLLESHGSGSTCGSPVSLVSLAISNARNWLSPSKSSVIVLGSEQERGLPGRLFSLGFHDLTI